MFNAWVPWLILCVVVAFWASDTLKASVNPLFSPMIPISGLDKMIMQMPPAFAKPTPLRVGFLPFAFLSYAGTGILVAAIIAGFVMGFGPVSQFKHYLKTLYVVRYPILTITAMLSLASVTSASGADGTLGLAFASTGALYPFFGTMLGWLGVAATGSDTAANALFGGLQMVTAHQTGNFTGPDGRLQLHRRGDGQDHLHFLHRGGGCRNPLGRRRIPHPALCLLAFGDPGLPGGHIGDAAGLCLALYAHRAADVIGNDCPRKSRAHARLFHFDASVPALYGAPLPKRRTSWRI